MAASAPVQLAELSIVAWKILPAMTAPREANLHMGLISHRTRRGGGWVIGLGLDFNHTTAR
jgi:hypothetical protein